MSEQDTINVALALGGAVCEVSSSRIESHEDRRISIQLTEDGFEEYIGELRLQDHDSRARKWLDEQTAGSAEHADRLADECTTDPTDSGSDAE